MIEYYSFNNCQTQAGTVRFCREIGIEHLGLIIFFDSAPRILYLNSTVVTITLFYKIGPDMYLPGTP